jgi:hypothetical protein
MSCTIPSKVKNPVELENTRTAAMVLLWQHVFGGTDAKTTSQDVLTLGRELKPRSLEYEAGVVVTQTRGPVHRRLLLHLVISNEALGFESCGIFSLSHHGHTVNRAHPTSCSSSTWGGGVKRPGVTSI